MAPDAYVSVDGCLASVGGEALGPVAAQCPSIGRCQGGEVVVGEQVEEHPHGGKGRGDKFGGVHDYETGKGDNV